MLKIKKLKKSYQLGKDHSEKVLKKIDLELHSGEFVAIYGPSGCGKSTLLNIISGLDQDYEGKILYQKKAIHKFSEAEIAEYRKGEIGFVFQNFNLIPYLNVIENVMLPMELDNWTKEEKEKKAMKLLKNVGLEKLWNKNITQLSGGQKQRVAIARALSNNPKVIIADEPTGALDSKSQQAILKILKKLANKGKLVVVVTHNPEVADFATHIIEMKDGQIIREELTLSDKGAKKQKFTEQKIVFSPFKAFKIAFKNFKQRKYRNLLVALGTSIGLTGILLSLGLGQGVASQIDQEVGSGNIPTQIQVMLKTGADTPGYLNQDNQAAIKKTIGNTNIKHFETPFATQIEAIELDSKKLDIATTLPAYSQLKSLFSTTKIKMAATDSKEVLAGSLYSDTTEDGLTLTKNFLDDFNKEHDTTYTADTLIGKEVHLTLVENGNSETKHTVYTTKIKRIIDSDDTNNPQPAYMSIPQLTTVLTDAGFEKVISSAIVELKDVDNNEKVVAKLNKTKRYTAVSQTSVVEVVMNFVKIVQGLLIFMSSQAVIVAVVMIGIVLYISVMERIKEIGVMKAVGFRNSYVSQIFLSEALLITITANIFALLSSLGIGSLINLGIKEYYPKMISVYQFHLLSVIGVFLISCLLAMVAALIPARKAMKLDPAHALRYE
ncbi:ABC transporter ATP-binding protein/permease [Carnobacterium gallinarum]|uniref:ABC transporter ATP-binding protein/permease n=1 Tax=Carnobacterium gallinarum TaxID=2749 RepID=UPI00054E4E5D|nr:ATP-binding cassette domain-containing protein [Carnobacterium gallinarum]